MIDMASTSELRRIAELLATETAELVARERPKLTGEGVFTKSSDVDPVTVVDQLAEAHLVDRLAELRPGDGVLGEEGADRESTTGVTWVIDPIDGTVNFLYGIPHYAVSVAAAEGEKVQAGAVVNVATGECYSAGRGQGATVRRDGRTLDLHANRETTLSRALLATGFSYSAERRERQGRLVASLLPRVRDVRRLGSAALDLCHVAEGRVDAYLEHGIHPWDYAAGSVIASEAGARVSAPSLRATGEEGKATWACAPGCASDFEALLAGLGAD